MTETFNGAPGWLSLAAAPTFAVMALLASLPAGGSAEMMCSAAHPSPVSGMVPMYLLMAAFHAGPWLELSSRRRGAASLAARGRVPEAPDRG